MAIGNSLVGAVLRSPLHRLVGRRLALVHYVGRRSGRPVTLPVQYVRRDDRVVIACGRADAKRWWRNFVEPAPAELLLDGRWFHRCELRVLADPPPDDPDVVAYLDAFPGVREHVAEARFLVGQLR